MRDNLQTSDPTRWELRLIAVRALSRGRTDIQYYTNVVPEIVRKKVLPMLTKQKRVKKE